MVGRVQLNSSDPSWQSFSRSHLHLALMHWPLSHRNWASVDEPAVVLQEAFSHSASSEPSSQSTSESHFHDMGMHLALKSGGKSEDENEDLSISFQAFCYKHVPLTPTDSCLGAKYGLACPPTHQNNFAPSRVMWLSHCNFIFRATRILYFFLIHLRELQQVNENSPL